MSIDGFVLPPRITLEEATRGVSPTGGVKRKALAEPDRHTNKGLPWRDDEHAAFLEGLERFGKGSWLAISRQCVPSRNPTQIASHAQKYFLRRSRGVSRASRFSRIEEGVKRAKPLERLCSWDGDCEPFAEESSSDDALAIFLPSGGSGGKIKHASCEIEQMASNAMLELAYRSAFLCEPATIATPPTRAVARTVPVYGTEVSVDVDTEKGSGSCKLEPGTQSLDRPRAYRSPAAVVFKPSSRASTANALRVPDGFAARSKALG